MDTTKTPECPSCHIPPGVDAAGHYFTRHVPGCPVDFDDDPESVDFDDSDEEPEMPDPGELIQFGQAWSKLGDVIARQVASVLSGEDCEVNPNAIARAIEIFEYTPLADEIVASLTAWMEELEEGESR